LLALDLAPAQMSTKAPTGSFDCGPPRFEAEKAPPIDGVQRPTLGRRQSPQASLVSQLRWRQQILNETDSAPQPQIHESPFEANR
jgi:hypothetical protein